MSLGFVVLGTELSGVIEALALETEALETGALETEAFETGAFGTIALEAISFRVDLLLDALSIALVGSERFLLVDLGVSEPRRPTRSTRESSRRSFC